MIRPQMGLLLVLVVACVFRTTCGSVIIIGAGPAGIATATKLLENNITDVIILEAEGRIGGRVHSIKFGDANVDLGAEWCHGQDGNVVYDKVKNLQVLETSDFIRMKFYYSTREEIDGDLNDKLFEIMQEIYSADGEKHQKEGISLGDYCIAEYNSSIAELHLNDTKQLRFANDVLPYFHKYVLSSEGSFSWFYPSAESDYRECEGDQNLNWGGYGYGTILDVMMGKFPNNIKPLPIDDKILLNKEVSHVVWDENEENPYGVTVQCTDGSAYNADHVVFTPSLGVLKDKYNSMFSPQLPAYKVAAINKLGIGAVIKVMLHFPTVWWPREGFNGFNFVWSSEDRRSRQLNEKNIVWIFDILGLYPSANNSKVLSAWFAGSHVPQIEKLSDATLLQGINFILHKFLGDIYNVTWPNAYIRSRWYTNPHFRGTYSYQTIASRKRNSNVDLSRPLANNKGGLALLFAGEATHDYHYSTVHGAIETGYREANRIINLSNVIQK